MRRVYTVWALKKLTSPVFMKFLILVGVVRLSFSMVSVPNIWHNSPSFLSDPLGSYNFFNAAFWHTAMPVKFITIAILLLAALLLRDILVRRPVLSGQSA